MIIIYILLILLCSMMYTFVGVLIANTLNYFDIFGGDQDLILTTVFWPFVLVAFLVFRPFGWAVKLGSWVSNKIFK